jgi:hypothetical protein
MVLRCFHGSSIDAVVSLLLRDTASECIEPSKGGEANASKVASGTIEVRCNSNLVFEESSNPQYSSVPILNTCYINGTLL